MSRFSSVLETILADRKISRSALARLCDVSPSTIGDYLTGEIEITLKNLALILRGITEPSDRQRLLLAHLADQVPEELTETVRIEPAFEPIVQEARELVGAHPTDAALLLALADLHSDLREEILWLVYRLRDDGAFRNLMRSTVSYLGDESKRVYRDANRRLAATDPSESVRDAVAAAKRASSNSRSTAS